MSSGPGQLAAEVGLSFAPEGFRMEVLACVAEESPQKL